MADRGLDRRRFLVVAGAASAATLAGCPDDEGPGENPEEEPPEPEDEPIEGPEGAPEDEPAEEEAAGD